MAYARTLDEYEHLIRSGEIVIVHYYDQTDKSIESRELYYAFKDLARQLSDRLNIITLQVDISQGEFTRLGVEAPTVRVYYRGRLVFEQKGGFSNSTLDYYVLRRSIRETLQRSKVDVKI
jgi:thioredoxin 1